MNQEFCPDESGRQLLSSYMYKTGTLPTGDEPETILPGWGFSYALRPYLSSMIGAFFMKASAIFYHSDRVLLAMSRMGSVLSVTGVCYYCLKLGNEVFKDTASALLFAAVACFFPQVMFLGMYQNNDSLSLMGVSMELYFLVRGYRGHWSIKNCIGLAVAFSVCILSYYSVYPWILMGGVFCVLSCMHDSSIENKSGFVIKRTLLVAAIVCLLTGWFFIRNALMHNGDFLGIASETVSRARLEGQGVILYNYNNRFEAGETFLEFVADDDFYWFRLTMKSLVGVFGYMDQLMPLEHYGEYYACIMIAFLVFFEVFLRVRKSFFSRALAAVFVISEMATVGLSLIQSYYRDFQPQGRYIITTVLVIGYVFAYGADHAYIRIGNGESDGEAGGRIHFILIALWLGMFARAWFGTMSKLLL